MGGSGANVGASDAGAVGGVSCGASSASLTVFMTSVRRRTMCMTRKAADGEKAEQRDRSEQVAPRRCRRPGRKHRRWPMPRPAEQQAVQSLAGGARWLRLAAPEAAPQRSAVGGWLGRQQRRGVVRVADVARDQGPDDRRRRRRFRLRLALRRLACRRGAAPLRSRRPARAARFVPPRADPSGPSRPGASTCAAMDARAGSTSGCLAAPDAFGAVRHVSAACAPFGASTAEEKAAAKNATADKADLICTDMNHPVTHRPTDNRRSGLWLRIRVTVRREFDHSGAEMSGGATLWRGGTGAMSYLTPPAPASPET